MKCRCAERRAAFERVKAATLRGDFETVKIEMAFITRTMQEDALNRIRQGENNK